MSALTEFLKARLAEDEAAARLAATVTYKGEIPAPALDHVTRHDPERVIREVVVKRLLIKRYERAAKTPGSVSGFVRGQDDGYRQGCLDAIKDAVAVYSDHPDYRQAWKAAVRTTGVYPPEPSPQAEFLAASVAVWHEIDRLDAEPDGYHPVRMSVELRRRERAAWERYRDALAAEEA